MVANQELRIKLNLGLLQQLATSIYHLFCSCLVEPRSVESQSSCFPKIVPRSKIHPHVFLRHRILNLNVARWQPPPQALRFSHGRGERETSDWWWTARDHGKGTDGRRSDVSPVVSFPPSFARTSRETSGYEAGALSNLGIRKAFPIGLYSTELCFHLVYMKISEIFIGLQVFYKWKGLENLAEKHNFITVEEGKFF